MKLLFALLTGEVGKLAKLYQKNMQAAAVAAMTDVTELAKVNGRKSIAAGGFSNKWQNAYRSRVYPNADKPLSPAGFLWHKIGYSSIFETGGTVTGKPTLWLPLPSVPLGRGSRPLTPKQYVERIGPLKPIRTGGRPMLVGRGSRAGITRATGRVVRVRKRAVKAGAILGAWVPLFVGQSAITINKRFGVEREARQASDKLADRYAVHFKPEG